MATAPDFFGDTCGSQNALMRLTNHLTQDQTPHQNGSYHQQNQMSAPTSFHMKTLIDELKGVARFETSTNHVQSRDAASSQPALTTALPASSSLFMMRGVTPAIHRSNALQLPDSGEWAVKYLESQEKSLEEDEALRAAARHLSNNTYDERISNSRFMEYVRNLANDEQLGDNTITESFVEKQRQGHTFPEDQATKNEFWDRLVDQWKDYFSEDMIAEDGSSFDVKGSLSEYNFQAGNPYHAEVDPLAVGLERLRQGDMSAAVLCFEAACQKCPESELGWQYLGLSLAESEREAEAINACRRCLSLAPFNRDCLLSLARSYVNEMQNAQAVSTLRTWLLASPEYATFVPTDWQPFESMGLASEVDYRKCEQALLSAACSNVDNPDAMVQEALGVLYNMSGFYEKAADCFRTALSLQPDQALLWNKLGATLANSGCNADAIPAYRRALELAPGLIRARNNLGIACLALGAKQEAAEHCLIALNQQEQSRCTSASSTDSSLQGKLGFDSDHRIWSLLRYILVNHLARQDLASALDERQLSRLNDEFGIQFKVDS